MSDEKQAKSMFAVKLNVTMDKNDEFLLLNMMEKIRHAYNDSIAFLREQNQKLLEDPEFLAAKEKNRLAFEAEDTLKSWPRKNGKPVFDEKHTKADYGIAKVTSKDKVKYNELYRKYSLDGEFSLAAALKTSVKDKYGLSGSIFYRSVVQPCVRAYEDYVKNLSRKMKVKTKPGKENAAGEEKKSSTPKLSFKSYMDPVTAITSENGRTFNFENGHLYAVLKSSPKYEKQVASKTKSRGQGVRKGFQKRELHISPSEFTPYKLAALTDTDFETKETTWRNIRVATVGYSIIRGEKHWTVSLIVEGAPPINVGTVHHLGCGSVGVDVGLSNAVIVSNNEYRVLHFCTFGRKSEDEKQSFKNLLEKKEELMREMCRLRVLSNPERFDEIGQWLPYKKGMPKLVESRKYRELKARVRELERKTAAYRNWSHKNQALDALTAGSDYIVENNDFKNMAKRYEGLYKKENGSIESNAEFGKHIGRYAPATFVDCLNAGVKKRGGSFAKINPKDICATGYNHVDDTVMDIPLEQRWVVVGGYVINRDGHAAFNLQHAVYDDVAGKYVIDRKACFGDFGNFIRLHNEYYSVLGTNEEKAAFEAAKKKYGCQTSISA